MTQTFPTGLPTFDAGGITATIEKAFAAAGLTTQTGFMHDLTETIRRALSSPLPEPGHAARQSSRLIDAFAREVGPQADAPALPGTAPATRETATPGEFITRQFRNHAGARAYKLYVPRSAPGEPMPLIVMLHGCTQSPDDFAAGTQMNALAEQHRFIVAYPEQAANANGSKCWNWFRAEDQIRDSGEPSIIAGITREIAATHAVDPRRIFVAGLSAGASMAVILGETYPELYAGVGAHSGLPYGAAHDMPSAFAAMAGSGTGMPDLAGLTGSAITPRKKATRFVPTIVFHGDADHTVGQRNGASIVQQAADALSTHDDEVAATAVAEGGVAPRGRSYTRTRYSDAHGMPRVESWVVHGAGHAWAGGNARGSYTDATGPDAGAEMVRFFLAQPQAGSA